MKIAILSDVHGNMTALRTCLDAIADQGCDKIYCLGDTFGYFQDGLECFEILRNLKCDFLSGNHEVMLLSDHQVEDEQDDVYQLSTEKGVLSSEMRCILSGLLPYKTVTFDTGKRFLLVHGSPWDPLRGCVYPNTNLSDFGNLPFDYIITGHTHRPFIREEKGIYIVNAGSCGLPRDIGNLASFAVYDCLLDSVEIVRPPLDVNAIEMRYPNAHPSVLNCLRC